MLTRKTGFQPTKKKTSLFSLYEWKSLICLLEQKRSFSECLGLLKNERNSETIYSIQSKLENGYSISEVLTVSNDEFTNNLAFLLRALPFVNALKICIRMKEFEQEVKEKLQGILLYPCLVTVFSLVVLLCFTNFIVPNILEMFSDMDIQTAVFSFGIKVLNYSIYFFIFTIVFFFSYYLIFVKNKGIAKLWKFASLLHINNILNQYISYMFSQYLTVLMDNGLPFTQAMKLLANYESKELISATATELDARFLKGLSLDMAIQIEQMDDYFCLLCQIGYEVGNVKESFTEYGTRTELRLRELLKKISVWIQIISYTGIGIVVIVVYQIMLLPLNVLEAF